MIDIKKEDLNTYVILRISGQVDASSSIHLDKILKEGIEHHESILIDLEKLEYISSAGLGVFIYYLDDIKEKNVKMILFGLSDKVYHVFEILGLHELLTFSNNEQEAIKQLGEV